MVKITDKATGDICRFETDNKKFYCHHKKGLSCKRCLRLIRGK